MERGYARARSAYTLSHPMDAVFLDDRRVRHGVTPIEILEPDQPAHRDVLVLTFRRAQDGPPPIVQERSRESMRTR